MVLELIVKLDRVSDQQLRKHLGQRRITHMDPIVTLFGPLFSRGAASIGDDAWLQAMLDAEAGLARALERAGLAPAGSGAAVTEVAQAGNFDAAELGGL